MNRHEEIQTITCPNCGKEIPLTDVLTKQIEEKIRVDYETQMKKKDVELHTALKAKDDEWRKVLDQECVRIQEASRKRSSEIFRRGDEGCDRARKERPAFRRSATLLGA